jgi:murein DD-endopeptidase MepM/ murein hydrolase activator NlpD
MRRASAFFLPLVLCLLVCVGPQAPAAHAAGTWLWPVSGSLLRPFDPPGSPFGAGHRGIDIGAPSGTTVVAPDPGTVTFAGTVAGHLFVTLAHGGELVSTYSWLSGILVQQGDLVARGQPIAASGGCHPGDVDPCLHLGVKLNDAYVDPLDYLSPLDVTTLIRLAPL